MLIRCPLHAIPSVILLVLSGFQFTAAQDLRIVSPKDYAELEGEGALLESCCPSLFRFQQIFPSEDFDGLPDGGALLTGFAWRPDADMVNSPREITLSNTVFRFSTTGMERPSTTFAENIGDDETTVRSGTFTVSTENQLTPHGTKEFDYVTEFDSPFFYNPSAGNLLWDWTGSLESSSLTDFTNQSSSIVFSSPPSSVGSRFGAYVVEFRFALPGDFNGDSAFTVEDIDQLTAAIATDDDDPRFDLNHDGVVNPFDLQTWVAEIKSTWIGDANLDGRFDSVDFVQVFQSGDYEDGIAMNSGWAEGDWNGDGDFDTSDLVFAFQDGGYEQGMRLSQAVPEPTTHLSLLVAIPGLIASCRHRMRH